MSKSIELIYSQQADGFVEGRAYSNPRFFSTPRQGISKVFLVGDWPAIEAAYKAMGVPVERLDAAPRSAPVIAIPPPKTGENPGAVIIPDGWRDLPWSKGNGGLTLRGLASSVSATPVINSAGAVTAIEAELKRRTLDVPNADANGLTLRELHADLEALGADYTPGDAPADLLALRDLHREERAAAGV